MKTSAKLAIVGAVAALVAVALASKRGQRQAPPALSTPSATAETGGTDVNVLASQKQALPRLVDLGARKCIPCKMMAPILEELKKEYAGRMDVVFIDVWENRKAGDEYGIKMIPTQIFYDAAGKELSRHEGFIGKEDILAKWKELGVDLGGKP